MQKFDWSVAAFNFGPREESYKLKVEEAEDNLSTAVEQLKAARQANSPDLSDDQIDEVMQEMLSALDKIRLMRTNMKKT